MKLVSAVYSATIPLALAASAHAAAFELDTEGKVTFGFNDRLENHTYLEGEFEIEVGQTFDNGFGWALSYEVEADKLNWSEDEVDYEDAVLLSFTTPIGRLAYGDMDKKGASERFYNDIDGMDIDVVRYKDGYPSLRWRGDTGGAFRYAVSSRNLINDDDGEISVGIGYDTNRYEFGLAWDNGSAEQDEAIAATVAIAAQHGGAETTYTVSHIEKTDASASGLSVEVAFEFGLTVEASYGFNHVADVADGFGIEVEYENGPWATEASYAFDGEQDEYDIAVAYRLADFAPMGTTLYAGYTYEEGSDEDIGYYAGAGFGIADNTVIGVAYSETTEGGDLAVQPGWSTMLSVAF